MLASGVFQGEGGLEFAESAGPASVSFNAGYADDFDGDGGTVSVTATPSLGLPGADGLGLYVGYAGAYSEGPDRNLAETGLTYLLGSETQIDVNGGVELGSGDYFMGIGVARRFR